MPVAQNRREMDADRGEVGRLYYSLNDQMPQYQGLWVVSPAGKALATANAAGADDAHRSSKTLEELESGLAKFGPVVPRRSRPRNLHPEKGIGVRPDGSVTLAITQKAIMITDLRTELSPQATPRSIIDSLTFSAAEWSTFAPPGAQVESQWTIPQNIGERFFRCLSGDILDLEGDATFNVSLTGRVASVRDGIAYLVYRGQIAGDNEGSKVGRKGLIFSTAIKIIDGIGAYDIRASRMLSLVWVWDGLHWGYRKPTQRTDPGRYGAVVEWRLGDARAVPALDSNRAMPKTSVELVDSTPEDALKTFLLALEAKDDATLRAVALPHAELEVLLKGPPAQPEQLALSRARLDEQPIRRLKAGDPVKMPNGDSLVIKINDVREGRVVLWPAGEPIPSRLENVEGRWKVFAGPYIAAQKQAGATAK